MIVYVGSEVTIGGWLFTFMTTVRHGTSSASSLVASSFWIGITVSRFTLGWITTYVGEKVMVSAYLILAIILQSVFWLGGEFVVSAVMAALIGFAIGMIMPAVSNHLGQGSFQIVNNVVECKDDEQDGSAREAFNVCGLRHRILRFRI